MSISIVVPVHNENENINPLLDEITAALTNFADYEIIYIDDGSQDDTLTILKTAQQTIPNLRVFHHTKSCGQSAAIYTGIKAAKFAVIATLDGDGQNNPADIPNLYTQLQLQRGKNPKLAMIAGWRNQRHDSAWRLFSSKFANSIRSRLLNDTTPDTGCGLKVFLRDATLQLPFFDHYHRFLPALMLRAGYQVVSVPVTHRARERGVSNYGTLDRLWVGISDIVGVMWLKTRMKLTEVNEIER
ncbi:MAG: glycosyltransferase family 2 protein [Methylococcales bacterium]|nr:glycosyltransferase family 2 protein [Methylococcales bacterium]MDD5753640.1 glycosyltransferase family 2 protein [Methylococcales bacterium]